MYVQASSYHYSYPKENIDDYAYEEVEVMCSENNLRELEYYRSDVNKNIFSYVPVQLVNKIIANHGGIDHDLIQKCLTE